MHVMKDNVKMTTRFRCVKINIQSKMETLQDALSAKILTMRRHDVSQPYLFTLRGYTLLHSSPHFSLEVTFQVHLLAYFCKNVSLRALKSGNLYG